MKTPFFSIVIVSLNAENLISDTIQSVLKQDCDDYEIIVKDGLSQDNTIKRIPMSDKIKVYKEKDGSIYKGMNQGIKYASGRYICFLNCGDIFFDEHVLKNIKKSADSYESSDMVIYGNYCRKNVIFKQPSKISRFYIFRTPICHQTMFIGKILFDKFGLYDTNYKIVADYDFTLKTLISGILYLYCNYTVCNYMGGGASETKEGTALRKQEYAIVRKKYFSDFEIKRYTLRRKLLFYKLRQRMILDSTPLWIRKLYRFVINVVNK